MSTESLRHPYLYFSEEDISGLREKLTHPWMQKKWETLLRKADIVLDEAFLPEPPEGSTEAHYNPAGCYLTRRAELLAFIGLVTGESRYLNKAKEHLLHVCRWRHWCGLGADGRVQPTIDAGIFGTAAAVVYDWLYDELSESERTLVQEALAGKVARPICRKYLMEDRREMTGPEINWPAQWFGAVGLVGMTLWNEHPEAQSWVKQAEDVMRGIVYWGNDPDGGGHEGLGYVSYMATNLVLFSEALHRVTGTNLFDAPFLQNLSRFLLYGSYEGPDEIWRINFNDSMRGLNVPIHQNQPDHFREANTNGMLLLHLAGKYRDRQAMWLYGKFLETLDPDTDFLGRNWNSPFEIIWFDPDLKPQPPDALPLCKHFRGIDWVVCRKGWKPSDRLFAFKSGRGRWWHIHADKNHFILWADGERLVIDPGIAPYIFSPDTAEQMQKIADYYANTGHNILLVDGEGQDSVSSDFRYDGPQAGRQESMDQAGRVLDFLDGDFAFYVRADGTQPYYGRLDSWQRHIFSRNLDYLVICDEVEGCGERRLEWMLHTPSGLTLERNTAHLVKDGRTLMSAHLFPPEDVSVRVREGYDEGLIWIPPEEKIEGDPLDMVPRAEYLSAATSGKVSETTFLALLDVHRKGNRRVEEYEVLSVANGCGVEVDYQGQKEFVLFRTKPGVLKYKTISTNGLFLFADNLRSPARLFVSGADALKIDGKKYLRASRPLTMSLKYSDSGLNGRIQTRTSTEVAFRVPECPQTVTTNGQKIEFRHNPARQMVSFSLRRGEFEITVATS